MTPADTKPLDDAALDALAARHTPEAARADRYAEALDAIIARGEHDEDCRIVYAPCNCGVCPIHGVMEQEAAKACAAPRHYAHGPDCAGVGTAGTRECVPACPTATAKRALEEK